MYLSRTAEAVNFHSNLIANALKEFLFFELLYIILFLLYLTANLKIIKSTRLVAMRMRTPFGQLLCLNFLDI